MANSDRSTENLTLHTPGPWKWYWREENGKAKCGVFWEKIPGHAYAVARAPQYEKRAQWEANARLISAAPELLAFARSVASHFDDSYRPGCLERTIGDGARAAIAKAEGVTG